MDGSGFAGKWMDECAIGECKGFDTYCTAIKLPEEEIEYYKDLVGIQVVTINGKEWSYTTEVGNQKKTNTFKIDEENPKDKDFGGYDFQLFPKLINEKKMIEEQTTWRSNEAIKTVMERTLNEAGDKQDIVVTEVATGARLEVVMVKV